MCQTRYPTYIFNYIAVKGLVQYKDIVLLVLEFIHDDVIKWKHFSCYWRFVRGIHQSPVNSPPQRPVTRNFDAFFDLRLNEWLSKPLPWASGLPVAIQCAWNLDPSVHWNATGERIVGSQCASISQCGSSGIPVYLWLQWSSSVFQLCKLTLDCHWVLASASVVPKASQCTCGSSGLPVWSAQWYPSVLTESDLEVIRSGHFPACDPLCIQPVWWELFEPNWFHLTCNPKYTKL